MTAITISFAPDMARAALEGRKVCTSRLRRKGEPGDTFLIDGCEFRLIATEVVSLNKVAYCFYAQEGFRSPEEFIATWNALYPQAEYQEETPVWLHWFAAVSRPIGKVINTDAPIEA